MGRDLAVGDFDNDGREDTLSWLSDGMLRLPHAVSGFASDWAL